MLFQTPFADKYNNIIKTLVFLLLLLIGVVIALVWFFYFPPASSINLGQVFFKTLYFVLLVSCSLVVFRVNIKFLIAGWFLLIYSFLLNILIELTKTSVLWEVYILGELITLSLLLIVIGVYLAVKRYQRAEKKIRKSEERYRLIFESSPEVIVLLDKKGKMITVNKRFEEWLDYKVGDFIGKSLNEFSFLLDSGKKKAAEKFKKRIQGMVSKPYELKFKRKDGKILNGKISASVIKNKKGKIIGDLVMVTDITRRKKAEKQVKDLKEMDRIKDEFLNVAAHEFKSPLASIIGMGQILEQQESNLHEEQKGYLKVIVNESLRLNWVVKQILTITRLETGKMKIKKEDFDLNEYLLTLVPSLKTLAKKSNSKIEYSGKKGVEVLGDKNRISEVMYNLVENAAKYGKKGQTITIRLSKGKNMAKVEVIDEGEGIPENLQNKIFVKFGQLEDYLRRVHEGIGLGLYICKVVVKKMGGGVGLKTAKNGGANFYFTVPLNRK